MDTILPKLNAKTCIVNGRELTYFGDMNSAFENHDEAVYHLPHMGVLSVEGDDALPFLQGQLSIDVTKRNDGDLGVYCNKEGRIISLFHFIQEESVCLLLMPKDIIEHCHKKLQRFALFSKVSLNQTSSHVLMLKHTNCITPLVLTPEKALDMLQTVNRQKPLLGGLAWHYQQLLNHIPSIYPNTLEKWLPHKLELHRKGVLNFDKGCYLGQEIIARMHFKAKLKHSLIHFVSTQQKAVNDTLYLDDKNIGEVIDISPCKDNKNIILASVLNDVHAQIEADANCIQ